MKPSNSFSGPSPLSDNGRYLPRTGSPPPAIPDTAALERLQQAQREAWADNTRRAYLAAWRRWQEWAGERGLEALPANPAHVAAFLAARELAGLGLAALRQDAAAIAAAHRLADRDNPCASPVVTLALRGFARAHAGREVRQASPLTAEAVLRIRAHLRGAPRRSSRAARDMALCSVMSDAGLRRSEAAALLWADIAEEADGSGRVAVRRSKTDQEGEGATVAITPAAMQDLEQLARLAGRNPEHRVFGCSDRTIARRIAALAEAAELGPGFSGHSGRVGMARRMVQAGAPSAVVMRQGRWETEKMVARYTRNEAAGEALKYL
ncbi:MAG: tyrosine-type recombinase/integrase [Rhodospirillaceae bacterium]|nr:tyrosine-type recombinase/integrase [Rhodospirillaceae bacterium]